MDSRVRAAFDKKDRDISDLRVELEIERSIIVLLTGETNHLKRKVKDLIELMISDIDYTVNDLRNIAVTI